ncbi:MAG: HAD family hydrolase [Planctomycetota bacterium]
MSRDWLSRVVDDRGPLEPVPTKQTAKLRPIDHIDVVLVDVYGTLLISGSGDVGVADEVADGSDIVVEVARSMNLERPNDMPTVIDVRRQIRQTNAAMLGKDNPKPEVEILDIWRQVLGQHGRSDLADQPRVVASLAAATEARLNPTWPMPGAVEALRWLRGKGIKLGIVSNAQEFTVLLIEDLIGGHLEDWFDLNLCFFSHRFRTAKPALGLFDRAIAELARCGVRPERAAYIGNDMLNDVWAASQVGLRTILFAGDARSLRLRRDQPTCAELKADVVLTDWNQLVECFAV